MAGQDLDKSPQAFRTISEVAGTLDIPAHVLRFWESRFPQLRPIKSSGGRRYYRPEDIELLRGIRSLLHVDGLTIKGVQKIFRENGGKVVVLRGQTDPEQAAAGAPDPAFDAEPAEAAPPAQVRAAPGLMADEPDPDDLIAPPPLPSLSGSLPQDRHEAVSEAIRRLEAVRDRILGSLPR